MDRCRAHVMALVMSAGAVVAACSAGPGPNASILGPDFRAKVLAVCASSVTLHTAMGGIPVSGFNPTRPDPSVMPSLARWLAEDGDRYATLVSELTALGSPPSGAPLWAAVIAAAKQHEAAATDQVSAATTGDVARFVKDYNAGLAAQAAFTAAIDAAGVPECAPVDH